MPRGCRQAYCAQKLFRFTNAKTYVFSDSVLCVGKFGDDPIATWKSEIKCYSENNHFKDMNRIDGMPTEFEWKIFPRITALGLLKKIQKLPIGPQCELEHFKGRFIFMSMFNDIVWDAKGSEEQCEYISQANAEYARKFPHGHWSFLGLDQKTNGTELILADQMDPGIEWQKEATANLSRSGHPIFRASSAFARGELRSKVGERSQHTSKLGIKPSSCFSAQ